ncbi:MAG: MarR family transcriptional regulator [Ferrovibrio sp.]
MTELAGLSIVHAMNEKSDKAGDTPQDPATMVALLAAVSDSDQHTQRSLANRLDVALGLANALLKRCVSKGFIKIQNAPARRYAYYLTPKGFAEKSRLVAEYLESSLNFFRHARGQYEALLSELPARGITRIAIVGGGELAEIALLSASSVGITIQAVVAPGRNIPLFHGHPVVSDLAAALSLGAEVVIIADNISPQAIYDRACATLPADRVLAPRLLHVTSPAAARKEIAA